MKTYSEEKYGVDLTKKENWTPIMKYIHTVGVITGFILGASFGFYMAILFVLTF